MAVASLEPLIGGLFLISWIITLGIIKSRIAFFISVIAFIIWAIVYTSYNP